MTSLRIIPPTDELRSLYLSGRLRAVQEKYGVGHSVAYRWCLKTGVAMSRKVLAYRDDVFDVIDSEHKAYVLGLIVADGYVVEGPKRYVVSLGSTDREIPEALRSLVSWGRELYVIPADPPRRRLSDEYRISLGSKRLVEQLVRLGVRQRKSLREVPPVTLDHAHVSHFVRGIFDGDGSVGRYGPTMQARFNVVGSQAICKFVAAFVAGAGLPDIACRVKNGDLWVVSCAGNGLVADVGKLLYDGAEHWLGRKKTVFDSIPPCREWKTARYGRPAPPVATKCDRCGRPIERKADQVRDHVFCTNRCWSAYYNDARKRGSSFGPLLPGME